MKPTWLHYPATGIVKGDPVYFAYLATFKDPKTGATCHLVADTKGDCIARLTSLNKGIVITDDLIQPIAIMQPASVKVVGGLVPYMALGADAGKEIPATEPSGYHPARALTLPVEDDDLI